MSHHRYAVAANAKRAGRKVARIALGLCLLALLATPICFPAHAQRLSDQWVPLSPTEFEATRSLFAPYGIETYRNNIVALSVMSLKIFRIESDDFCTGPLCLTLVISVCGRTSCPSTAVFVKRAVEVNRGVTGHFGGTWLLVFPLSTEGNIVVMVNKTFVGAWRGFGEG